MVKIVRAFVDEGYPTYSIMLDMGEDTREELGLIQQRDSWSAPLARKRWALDIDGRTTYHDSLKQAKFEAACAIRAGFRVAAKSIKSH